MPAAIIATHQDTLMLSPSPCLALDYQAHQIGRSEIVHADSFEWLGRIPENCLHAVVTDPPYGVKEFEAEQLDKRASGAGGVWRIPPSFDGHLRSPLPRFTALNAKEREALYAYFIASHPSIKPQSFLRQIVHAALPLGVGVVADPFMGSGSTVAAAEAVGVRAVGVERRADFFEMSRQAIPQLAALPVESWESPSLIPRPERRGYKRATPRLRGQKNAPPGLS